MIYTNSINNYNIDKFNGDEFDLGGKSGLVDSPEGGQIGGGGGELSDSQNYHLQIEIKDKYL